MRNDALLVLALAGLPVVGSAQAKKHEAPTKRAVTIALPDQVTWGAAPAVLPAGAKLAVLEGDPTKSGAYTMRLFMPNGYRIPPHFHAGVEHVTVVSGALMVGMGETFDEAQMKTLPAGTFAAIPVGMHHYAKAQGETVLQLHGIGPWRLTYVHNADDPRKKVATM